jgi:hypothetical protein
LKNKGFKEERMTKVGLYAVDKSTTLESNKSPATMVMVPAPATQAMQAMALPCTFPLVGPKESRYDLQGHRWCESLC